MHTYRTWSTRQPAFMDAGVPVPFDPLRGWLKTPTQALGRVGGAVTRVVGYTDVPAYHRPWSIRLGAAPGPGQFLAAVGVKSEDQARISKANPQYWAALQRLDGLYTRAYVTVSRITNPGMRALASRLLETLVDGVKKTLEAARIQASAAQGTGIDVSSFKAVFNEAISETNEMLGSLTRGVGTALAAPFQAVILAAKEAATFAWQEVAAPIAGKVATGTVVIGLVAVAVLGVGGWLLLGKGGLLAGAGAL